MYLYFQLKENAFKLFLFFHRAVSSDSGNYSCSPSNAEADMVGVHVLEGTGKGYTLFPFLCFCPVPYVWPPPPCPPYPGGLPRANVMASSSPPSILPKQASLLIILVAFNIRQGWYPLLIYI